MEVPKYSKAKKRTLSCEVISFIWDIFLLFRVHNPNETEFLIEEKDEFHNTLRAHILSKTGNGLIQLLYNRDFVILWWHTRVSSSGGIGQLLKDLVIGLGLIKHGPISIGILLHL